MSDATSIEEKVIETIAEVLSVPVDQVTPEARLTDGLSADSLDLVELLVALEDAFDIDLFDAEFSLAKTVKDVVEHMERRTTS